MFATSRWLVLLLSYIVLQASCARAQGSGPVGANSAHGGQASVARARARLAEDPRDGELHLALAHALLAAHLPGGAIRHFEEAERRSDLDESGRRSLAQLYLARATQRLTLGDGDAWRDLDRAKELAPEIARERADGTAVAGYGGLLREALFAAAVAELRRAGSFGTSTAKELLERARSLAPSDPRLAVLAPATSPLAAVMVAGRWLDQGGANRAALEVYQHYVDRGGRAVEHATRYLALHTWWHGDRALPSGILLDDLRRAGVDVRLARDAGGRLVVRDRLELRERLFGGAWDALDQWLGDGGRGLPSPSSTDHPSSSGAAAEARGDDSLVAALVAIVRAVRRDPALGQQAADDFIDGEPAASARGVVIAQLYLALGDPHRAWRVAAALALAHPRHPPALLAAAITSVAVGAPDRADLFFTDAAAASGSGGHVFAIAAAAYLAESEPVHAVSAAKRALALLPSGQHDQRIAARLAALGLARLGRTVDAGAVEATYRARVTGESAPVVIDALPPIVGRAQAAAIAAALKTP